MEDAKYAKVRSYILGNLVGYVKEHVVPPCEILVINDILYGLMVALNYTSTYARPLQWEIK